MNVNRIKNKLIKIKMKLGLAISKEEYAGHNKYMIQQMRSKGMSIGKGTMFYDFEPKVDMQRPWMVEIGEYCKITTGVTILQHDYSRSVLRRVYGSVIGEAKKTIIGNNVFIGMNSTVLMGAHIGSNVIVGAGSVVAGNIPDNVVVAGNPAKVIRSLEEHYLIRKSKCEEEARSCAREYYRTFHKCPTITEMGSFFPLYLPRERNLLAYYNIDTALSGDDEQDIILRWLETDPIYENYDLFLESCNFPEDA